MYNPVIGRWISVDPLGTKPGEPDIVYTHEYVANRMRGQLRPFINSRIAPTNINLYAYSNNNPIRYKDPSGLAACDDFVSDIMGYARIRNMWWAGPDYIQRRILTNAIACRFLSGTARQLSLTIGTSCENQPKFNTPSGVDGFCPQLSMGTQGTDLYRHLAFAISNQLLGTSYLTTLLGWGDCSEVRDSCGCACPPSTIPSPTDACLEDQAEVIGNKVGKKSGTIIRSYMDDQISHATASKKLKNLLCNNDCGETADNCCPAIVSAESSQHGTF